MESFKSFENFLHFWLEIGRSPVLHDTEALCNPQQTLYNPQQTLWNPLQTLRNPQQTLCNPLLLSNYFGQLYSSKTNNFGRQHYKKSPTNSWSG